MTASTPSATLRADVLAAIKGAPKGALNFLKNFKLAFDGAETTSPAAVSTKVFYDTRTLAASASENLDLNGGLSDENGAAVNFTTVQAIYIRPAAGNTNKVNVGGAGANGFVGGFADITDIVKVGPGQTFLQTSKTGWTVVAGTGDILKVANDAAGTAVTYDIVIIGS